MRGTLKVEWRQFYKEKNRDIIGLISNVSAHKEFIKTIVDNAPIGDGLLEVGTGTADMCIFTSWLGYKVTSIDNDQSVLQKAMSRDLMRTAGDLKLLKQDAFNLSFSDKSFALAFSQGFFEHFSNEDIVQLVKEQLRVANKVIFSVPSFWYPRRDFGNERLMKIKGWLDILSDFKISKPFYYGLTSRIFKHFLQHKPLHICMVIEGS
ncbi:class I SAM-dependent methyltransferase [bacterium]|nr:class I SAM-dependent methyltransferase [bacterium]MBU4511046.1 class I SAM-dependent methyltransferase [bacterium]